MTHPDPLSACKGILFGQAIGDALGAQVEFCSVSTIERRWPNGVRILKAGGTWNLAPGQITDDTEMATCLGHALVESKGFDAGNILRWYQKWRHSGPFDIGMTTAAGLQGTPNPDSQANGALMRISPLAVAGFELDPMSLASLAMTDAALTHPHPVCQQANAVFVLALQSIIRGCRDIDILMDTVKSYADQLQVDDRVRAALEEDNEWPIVEGEEGWVVPALANAFYQLRHAPSFEEGVVRTIGRGGDTDTTAAIAGALLGAWHTDKGIPESWLDGVWDSQSTEAEGTRHPRPDWLWSGVLPEMSQTLHAMAASFSRLPDRTPTTPKR